MFTPSMISAVASRAACDLCGKPLETTTVHVLGQVRRVPVYGSCGCKASAERMAGGKPSAAPTLEDKCRKAGIPPEYLAYSVECGEAADAAENGRNIWIEGENGRGKSVFAGNIARELISRGHRVKWMNCAEAVKAERDRMATGAPSAWEIYERSPFLVLDDIGKENATDYTASLLYELAEVRNANGLPTITTSNYGGGKLIGRLTVNGDSSSGTAIVSRLKGKSYVVRLGGQDMRISTLDMQG